MARQGMRMAFNIDVSKVGLDDMREYPELGEQPSIEKCHRAVADTTQSRHVVSQLQARERPAVFRANKIAGWASVHVSMNHPPFPDQVELSLKVRSKGSVR